MKAIKDTYTLLITSIERIALGMRYVCYAIMAPLFLLGYIEGNYRDFAVVTVVVVLHNAFAHWALWTGRHALLVSPWNFLIYFAETSVIILFTGAEESAGFVLYFLFLIGFSAYCRDAVRLILVTLLCCGSYAAIVSFEWYRIGLAEAFGVIVFKNLSILLCGLLLANLSRRLRDVEVDSFTRAQELAASEATLRTILDHTADPIFVFDDNEFLTMVNDRACELFALHRDELLGQRVRKFMFDDGTLPAKLATLRSRGAYQGEQLLVAADGAEHAADIVVRSFIREQQRYHVALVHDITPQKELQETTREANSNLERLNRELRQVNALRTGFLASVSQKLRSPLSAVLGYLDMLLDEELGPTTAEQRRALQTCRRGTLRAFRVLDEAQSPSGSANVRAPQEEQGGDGEDGAPR